MGIFNFFTVSEDQKLLAKILSFAEVTLPEFQEICNSTSLKGQFEMYMINLIYLWNYFTLKQLFNPTNTIIN